ncbi:MAG: helix-turn-helix domain-containing protein [Gammaproteobacteria bacterium]|nr:helix-turn-helix domain-containing protein [Gammaproteobacteria bacterium]MBU1481099.1 helix-turn-helix domain-containing protein [Gammaproteobacteria bacterium]
MQHEALRLVRVFHDLNQTTLAERLGISNSYLSEIESGKKAPTLELLQKYATTFDMPVSSLLFFSENLDSPTRSDKVRATIARKTIKMLQWISAKDTIA